MSETVNLPALGESVTEGTVTRWLVEVGESVEVDQPIVEVSTDKVDTEIPSPVAGVIEEILAEEDDTIEVGEPLVRIGDGDGSSSDSSDDDSAAEEEAEEPAAEEEEAAEQEDTSSEEQEEEQQSSSDSGSEDAGESQEVKLPELGESITEGTVTRWLKEIGEEVEVDEPLLEVSTDKVDTEIPSPVAGTLLEIRADEDDTVEVGGVLAIIGSGSAAKSEDKGEDKAEEQDEDKSEEKSEQAPAEDKTDKPAEEAPATEEKTDKASAADQDDNSAAGYVTPLVRRLAKDKGVDLSTVKGTGVGGRIRKQDVEAAAKEQEKAAAAPAPAAAPAGAPAAASAAPQAVPSADTKLRGTTEKAPRIRQVIARRMRESLDISTQLTQVIEVDMTRIWQLRAAKKDEFRAREGVNLTFLPFIAKAVAESLKAHPKLNALYDEEKQEITYHDKEHIAIAVDTDRGLLVPVINDAGSLNMSGLASRIADLGARARDNKVSPDELSGGTFSITNIGSVGALFDTPIINQPQVAILGTGAIVKRPMVISDVDGNDTIAIRNMMYLCLTYDHRLVDGADAGRFLQSIKARLEEGAFGAEL
ncbi:2-oxoglutarate dehydrogenase, E2 component, dihydrolipoamide succinyltransferase [Micrococcoides hystricis]|uniref:Dihydrolipoamide acetyltransferase component of pyruvate dehydrogenase complex n=1 Tax=Micrococcoides hystricis TaxID=1572761 RepID=A0ABV6P6U4_9MICC